MIKIVILLLSLSFIACTSNPDLRPDVYINADNLLQSGIDAYKNDRYQAAKQYFNRAIKLYQSVAYEQGIDKARLNIANTALAYSDFSTAQIQIDYLKQQAAKGLLETVLRRRLIFLEVKFYFTQQDYAKALDRIKPLLKQPPFSLSLIATMARLEVLNSAATKTHWLVKFQQVLTKLESKNVKQQMILNRILAFRAFKQGNYKQAENLLNQALNYYKKQANRRGIANCLEKLAELSQFSKNFSQAQILWNKALKIRLWLKDDYKAKQIRKQLIKPS